MATDPATRPRDHLVTFYDDDADLIAGLRQYVRTGLDAGGAILVIATPVHRKMLDDALEHDGFTVWDLRATGQYVCVDAAATLADFMVDGCPDATRFRAVIRGLLPRAAGSTRLYAFGEMVALLWGAGNLVGALELESLWNDLMGDLDFSLLCGYPTAAVGGHHDLTDVGLVCSHHSEVRGPLTEYPVVASAADADGMCSAVFVPVPQAVRAVRRFVVSTLESWSYAELSDAAVLVASELATNAVIHARSAFRLSLERRDGGVRMELHDLSTALPVSRIPDHRGGRGLGLIDHFSSTWGAQLRADGKVVWSQLRAPASL